MGYDVTRFEEGTVDEELICAICSSVLQDPVQTVECEHAFCEACIKEWLNRQSTCPIDRQHVTKDHLKPVPRILRNLLGRLQIKCNYANHGCTAVLRLDSLTSHIQECDHNPQKPVSCDQGCGLVIPKDDMQSHNCVRDLRCLVTRQQNDIESIKAELCEQKHLSQCLKREVHLLKEYMRAVRSSNPRLREIQSEIDNDEIHSWVNCLQTARVTRYGGMISTPDAVLQAVIKRALSDSGCPASIANELMENAHERRWPPGLSTLETRQLNRRQYENYDTKRIPGKQAVVVMACTNQHMPADMILEPGLVMIFAHGVE